MKKQEDRGEVLRALALLTQLGLSMACCVFVGVLAGKFLDRFLGTSPWCLIVGAVIGGGASFKVLYDLAIRRYMTEPEETPSPKNTASSEEEGEQS